MSKVLNNIKIFVEGVTDIKFLQDFIFVTFNQPTHEVPFIKTNGYGELFNEQNLIQLRSTNDNDGNNLVIFDANGNIVERRQEILNKAVYHSVEMSLFLFPNNNDAGDRELLMENIANPSIYKPFFACYKPYQDCLQNYNSQYFIEKGLELKIPPKNKERKLRIINYLNLYGQKSDEDKRDYTDIEYWDLTHEYLQPLRDFLSPYF